MKKVPFTNTTEHLQTVAGRHCWPGETIMVAERDHPDYKPKKSATAPSSPPDLVGKVLGATVAEGKDMLPELTDEQLQKVSKAGKTKGIREAADELLLERAKEAETGNGESAEGGSGDGESGEGESGEGESGEGESGDGESGEGESGDGESGEGESGEGKDAQG